MVNKFLAEKTLIKNESQKKTTPKSSTQSRIVLLPVFPLGKI